MSLRLKTIIGIAFIEAVLLLLLVSMTLDYLRSTNYDALIKRASTTATLFATTTKDAVLSYDLASLDAFVNDVLINPDLVYARVLGPDSNLFAEGGKAEYLRQQFVADHRVETASDGVFDTFAEIKEGGVTYGRVEIGLSISSIHTTIAEAQSRSVIVAVLEMGLVALFSFLLGAYLTGQLKVLSLAAQSISEGKLDIQLPVKGRDEIANVATAFNAMAFNLREVSARRDQFEIELKELNLSLEDRVEQRTQQMRNKNRQLEQANREIKEVQAKLLQSEKMASIGQLAAGIAHEINNPVGFINSNVDTLKTYLDDLFELINVYEKEAKDLPANLAGVQQFRQKIDFEYLCEDIPCMLEETQDGLNRVKKIVRDLMDFSRTNETELITYDLRKGLESTLNVALHELKYKAAIIKEFDDIPEIECMPSQLNQVFMNLMVNAAQAMDKKGAITLRTKREENQVIVEVEDNGSGIDPEHLNRLFDPFFTTKPVGSGTGLGLSVSYGIVKKHNGHIEVNSHPGEGTCFRICLPVKQPKAS